MSHDWLELIGLSINPPNLFARTLVTNLYKDPTEEIGWKSPKEEAILTLGIRVTKK